MLQVLHESYLFEPLNEAQNKLGWRTIYSNRTNSATFVNYVDTIIEALSRWCIFAID